MAVRIVASWYYVDRESNQVDGAPTFSSWTQDTYGYSHYFAQEDYTLINEHTNVQGNHSALIRKVAADGTVLLKNNGALPLSGKEKLTTVFGSDAGENVYGPNGCSDRGCDMGTLAMGWGSGEWKNSTRNPQAVYSDLLLPPRHCQLPIPHHPTRGDQGPSAQQWWLGRERY
jgi:beta-glucosidase